MRQAEKKFPNGFVRVRTEADPGDSIYFGALCIHFGDDGGVLIEVDKRRTFEGALSIVPLGNGEVRLRLTA